MNESPDKTIRFESALDAHSEMRNVGDVIDGWQDVEPYAPAAYTITVTPPPAPREDELDARRKSMRLKLSFLDRPRGDNIVPSPTAEDADTLLTGANLNIPVLPIADMPTLTTQPPIRRREGTQHADNTRIAHTRNGSAQYSCRAPSDPDRLMPRRRFAHLAPEVAAGRYMMGVSGASSILTPRYIATDDAAEENSPSAEELNEAIRRSDPILAKIASLDVRPSSDPGIGLSSLADLPSARTSVSVTLLQSMRPSMLSVDGSVPLGFGAVCSPLSRIVGRPTRVVQAVINVDCSGMYESSISPYDCRDHAYESEWVVEDLTPAAVDLRPTISVRNDGSRHGGMGVALHMALMLEINTQRYALCPSLSPAFLYYNRRCRPVYGMHGRDALRIMLKVGVAETAAYEWTGDDYYAPPITEDSYRTARRHRIQRYAAIASGLGLKCALAQVGVCYILLPLFGMRPRFWCADIRSKEPVRIVGVQSALVVGYDESGFILSIWDTGWVGDRTVWFSYNDWNSVIECWVAFVDSGALRASDAIGSMICPTRNYGNIDHYVNGDMHVNTDGDICESISPAYAPPPPECIRPAKKISHRRNGGCTIS